MRAARKILNGVAGSSGTVPSEGHRNSNSYPREIPISWQMSLLPCGRLSLWGSHESSLAPGALHSTDKLIFQYTPRRQQKEKKTQPLSSANLGLNWSGWATILRKRLFLSLLLTTWCLPMFNREQWRERLPSRATTCFGLSLTSNVVFLFWVFFFTFLNN